MRDFYYFKFISWSLFGKLELRVYNKIDLKQLTVRLNVNTNNNES